MTKEELCALAVDAMKNAYVPYSGFTVGAALLTSSGKVYTGCNIENASFTPTVCSESGRYSVRQRATMTLFRRRATNARRRFEYFFAGVFYENV